MFAAIPPPGMFVQVMEYRIHSGLLPVSDLRWTRRFRRSWLECRVIRSLGGCPIRGS